MKRGINLKLTQRKSDNNSKKILLFSGIFFIITVICALTIIVYRIYLGNVIADNSQKERNLTSLILQQQTKKAKLFDLHRRLSEIEKIIEKRSKVVDDAIFATNVVPTDASVESLGAEKTSVDYTIKSENLNTLNELLEKKIFDLTKDKNKKILTIELKSFGLIVVEGKYELAFRIVLN